MKSSLLNKIAIFASIISIILLWKILALVVNAQIILPSPEDTFVSLVKIIRGENFFPTVFGSMARWIISFVISLILALIVGTLSGINMALEAVFKPYLHIVMATPVMAIVLVALLWFDKDTVPVFVSILMCFPILCNNVSGGVKSIDDSLIEMARVYGVKWYRILLDIYLPSMLPYIVSGIRSAMGIGWKVIVVAEVISQPKYSIGTSLYDAKILLETEILFAWTVIAVLLSFLFDWLTKIWEKNIIKWK